MRQRWTLNVENFGKIEKGEIELSPLMLFVGENNSGKSYIMSLLWGIFSFAPDMIRFMSTENEAFTDCVIWLSKHKSEDEFIIDKEGIELFTKYFNLVLDKNKEELIEHIFNHKITIGKVYVSDYKADFPIKVVRYEEDDYEDWTDQDNHVIPIPYDVEIERIVIGLCEELFIDSLLTFFLKIPLYLPASRTGFMLSYKTLLANTIDPPRARFSDKETGKVSSRFPQTVTKFLRLLVQADVLASRGNYSEIATEIEQKILKGKLSKDDSPVPNFLFTPQGYSKEIPLHVTSSLVSELTPIVLFLKSDIDIGILIVEEPEAHLHVQAQKTLANAMIRLVNDGLPVWLTTHSETVFQQVNNMIKLFNHRNKQALMEQFGYETEDMVNPAMVRAYQFTVNERGKTCIESLQLTEYGFIVPTFNDALEQLLKETYELEDQDDVDR